jgi:predicted RNA polymerase sigma factor
VPRVLGAVARRHPDFDAAEDAVQDALAAAAAQWPVAGVPDNPGGWLFRVALRRRADQARSDEARRRRENASAAEQALARPFALGADEPMGGERG